MNHVEFGCSYPEVTDLYKNDLEKNGAKSVKSE